MKSRNLFLTAVFTAGLFNYAQTAPAKHSTLATVTPETVQEYRQRATLATPDSVLKFLKDGNIRFASGLSNHGGYPVDARNRIQIAGQGQRPIAAVLSCIDSRTTPDLVFDTAVGDIFTARVGANVTNDDIIGSLEIAVESGAKVVIVMGHSDCGGVRAACAGFQLGHMTQLLDRIKPAIATTNLRLDSNALLSTAVGARNPGNRRYISEVSHDNAKMSVDQLLQKSTILKEKVDNKDIYVLSAIYDVETGEVRYDPIR